MFFVTTNYKNSNKNILIFFSNNLLACENFEFDRMRLPNESSTKTEVVVIGFVMIGQYVDKINYLFVLQAIQKFTF